MARRKSDSPATSNTAANLGFEAKLTPHDMSRLPIRSEDMAKIQSNFDTFRKCVDTFDMSLGYVDASANPEYH